MFAKLNAARSFSSYGAYIYIDNFNDIYTSIAHIKTSVVGKVGVIELHRPKVWLPIAN